MLSFSLSLVIGFIVNVAVGTIVAQLIANPLTRAAMSKFEREKKDMKMGPMLAGYFIITLIMVLAYPYFGLEGSWIVKGAVLGGFSGAISFVSVYLIVSGWSLLPPKEMFISGLVDVASTLSTGLVIAFIYNF